jgi:hypothetical protein
LRANITPKELKTLKRLAITVLGLGAETLEGTSAAGAIAGIRSDGQDTNQAKSGILCTVRKTAAGLHRADVIDKATMRELVALCLTLVSAMAPKEIAERSGRMGGRSSC